MPLLFSYGTLQLPQVQLDTFGRLLTGTPDFLLGYQIQQVEITDEAVLKSSGQRYHPILYRGNESDSVSGTVFEITQKELEQADGYEVGDYQRVEAPLQSGNHCWVYVAADINTP
ncbi:gamma-glutamylcyclotransferase family protein [Pseudoalteromonas fenneropenaei]|uniref:Gamma-glutamylcyclotransferase family protein n=1 Tax=Pseudoalteromonas fenneropenaei TaxID=1737459 RepID=A0ABV7CGA1_9GAMM